MKAAILVILLLYNHPDSCNAEDVLYADYKDKTCEAKFWELTGCYKANHGNARGEMLINWKPDIEWEKERLPHFANSLVCACAEAAKRVGVVYFGTHSWGECFALTMEQIEVTTNGDCLIADETHNTYCHKNFDTIGNHSCLGVKNYYVHKIITGKEIFVGSFVNHGSTDDIEDYRYVMISLNFGIYKWSNRAGVEWTLTPKADYQLNVGKDCPFYKDGHTIAEFTEEGVFVPWGEFYRREGSCNDNVVGKTPIPMKTEKAMAEYKWINKKYNVKFQFIVFAYPAQDDTLFKITWEDNEVIMEAVLWLKVRSLSYKPLAKPGPLARNIPYLVEKDRWYEVEMKQNDFVMVVHVRDDKNVQQMIFGEWLPNRKGQRKIEVIVMPPVVDAASGEIRNLYIDRCGE